MSSTPSLGPSDESAVDSSSTPTTPSMLPHMSADVYALQPIDTIPLQQGIDLGIPAVHHGLPDILDPRTAAGLPLRHVCCIGAGYVGGPTAAVIALHNPHVRVTVVDRDVGRIRAWNSRHLPIQEPGLAEVVRIARDGAYGNGFNSLDPKDSEMLEQNHNMPTRLPNLFFSTACTEAIAIADIILVSVNTPTKRRGIGAGRATDMAAFEGAIRDVAMHAKPGTILVEKSTVPCKTGQLMKDILEAYRPDIVFPVLSNPEFLSEGTAIRDLLQPDRVIIGCESTISGHRAAAALTNLYAAWVPRSKIAPINIWSSELCKLAANAMLAQRISSINAISAICERTGADVSEIAKSVGMDNRIGPQFLKAGLGFGGSCFRKDIASLTYLAESLGLPEVAAYWQQVLIMNEFQRDRFARNVIACLNNTLRGKKITILGYAFKKNTGDARESPALDVIRILLEENPRTISIFDPLCSALDIRDELRALPDGRTLMKPEGPIEILSDPYIASQDSNAILVLTDWDMFKAVKPMVPSKTVASQTPILEATTPATLFQIDQRSELSTAMLTPPMTPKSCDATSEKITAKLMPEPSCPDDCTECQRQKSSGDRSPADQMTSLDWYRISQVVKEPRWVFDGRGILDGPIMVSFGFRLQTLGRASMY